MGGVGKSITFIFGASILEGCLFSSVPKRGFYTRDLILGHVKGGCLVLFFGRGVCVTRCLSSNLSISSVGGEVGSPGCTVEVCSRVTSLSVPCLGGVGTRVGC